MWLVPPEYSPVPGTETLSVGLEQGAASRGVERPLQPHRPGLQQEWMPQGAWLLGELSVRDP